MPRSRKKGSQVIDQSGAFQHKPSPRAVQGLHIGLFLGLDPDTPHRGTRRGFSNRLRVAVIILLRLHIWFDVFRRHEPNFKTRAFENTPQMMRATARFHCNHASVEVQDKGNKACALKALSKDNRTRSVWSGTIARAIARRRMSSAIGSCRRKRRSMNACAALLGKVRTGLERANGERVAKVVDSGPRRSRGAAQADRSHDLQEDRYHLGIGEQLILIQDEQCIARARRLQARCDISVKSVSHRRMQWQQPALLEFGLGQ